VKAVQIRRHGDPDVVEWADFPEGEVGPNDVRIEVRATGVNHLDMWVRRGLPGKVFRFPHPLGADAVGQIVEVGALVTWLHVGDRVVISPGVSCGRCERCSCGQDNLCPQYGTYCEPHPGVARERVVVPARNVERCPEGLGDVEAAAIAVVYMTAWQMLVERARVQPGEYVLIQGAAGGVGTAGIQIAHLLGAKVIALSASPAKLERLRELGADVALSADRPDFAEAIADLTGGRGLDVVFEHIGRSVWSKSLIALRRGGRLVTCGATSGYLAETDLRYVFFRQLSILGSTMASRGVLPRLLALAAEGRLRPIIDRVMPMRDAAEAHRLIESRSVFGKVVLVP
jgi:NADPH:quinone reductase-like Zn-dependent oxidoreductase